VTARPYWVRSAGALCVGVVAAPLDGDEVLTGPSARRLVCGQLPLTVARAGVQVLEDIFELARSYGLRGYSGVAEEAF